MAFVDSIHLVVARFPQLTGSKADELAEAVADLAEAAFGPFDPEIEAAWLEAKGGEITPPDRVRLIQAASAEVDPLRFLSDFRMEQGKLFAFMRVRWSFFRARKAGRPETLPGLAWSDLDPGARADVRQALEHLERYEMSRVRPGAKPQEGLDAFLLCLGDIVARQTGFPRHATELSSHIEGDFISLAVAVLDCLPPCLPNRRGASRTRVHVSSRSAQALSFRWRKLRNQRTRTSD